MFYHLFPSVFLFFLLLVLPLSSLLLPTAIAQHSTIPLPPSLLPTTAIPQMEAGANAAAPGHDATAAGTGDGDLVEVVAQGMGIDQPSALNNAYSNAVQQALGLYVDAETLVQNDEIVRDQILTYSRGFIQKADIISQSQVSGLFQVNIRAMVQRQKLLEKARASNITIKQVEGVSLHAQVATQIKQEQDAKALLEKTLQPLLDATLLRAELLPSTQQQPNPTINKEGTDDRFVTLDYKVSLWIDESEYYNYVKNTLIPVLNQIAVRKGELTANYRIIDGGSYDGTAQENAILERKEKEQSQDEFSVSVLTWKDRGLTTSKWQWFFISEDQVPDIYKPNSSGKSQTIVPTLCRKAIELSLLDEKNEIVALGDLVAISSQMGCRDHDRWPEQSNSPLALSWQYQNKIRISPYFTQRWMVERYIVPPKSGYFMVSIKIHKEDIPRVRSAKLEVNSAGE